MIRRPGRTGGEAEGTVDLQQAVSSFKQSRLLIIADSDEGYGRDPKILSLAEQKLGVTCTRVTVAGLLERADQVSDEEASACYAEQKEGYREVDVDPDELVECLKVAVALHGLMQELGCHGASVCCFGDFLKASRHTPCLGLAMLRQQGFITACDSDVTALLTSMIASYATDQTAMMANVYPLANPKKMEGRWGAFLPPEDIPEEQWPGMARFAHCAFAGVAPPCLTADGVVNLHPWGSTRSREPDRRGCGVDPKLPGGEITIAQLQWDVATMLVASGELIRTDRHDGMHHCQATALLRCESFPALATPESSEHLCFVYGNVVDGVTRFAKLCGLHVKEAEAENKESRE